MQYSFIAPRAKKLISSEVRLVLIIFMVLMAVLLMLYAFFLSQNSQLENEKSVLIREQHDLHENNKILMQDIAIIEKQVDFSEELFTENTLLKENIKNLFDLIPDTITLSKVMLSSDALTIEGTTKDKTSFKTALQIPLRSIFFHESGTVFMPLKDGSFYFVSRNTLKKEKQP